MEAAAAVPGPSQATTLSWIATQVEAEGDPAAARRMYQKALGADPACAVAGRRLCAMLHGMPGGGDLVRRLCTEMARRSAQAAWAHVVLGQIDEARGESRDAIGHYQRALRCNEEDAEVWESLGRAYVGQGRAEAASKVRKRVGAARGGSRRAGDGGDAP